MTAIMPTILALDFDGVVCDGLIEYFQAAWKAYCRIWNSSDHTPPEGLAEQFYRMRPVVETGWEMPVVVRSLLLGVTEDEILQDWAAIAKRQITADQVSLADLEAAVDSVRDEWIKTDLEDWLSQHRFYPGVIDRLKQTLSSPVHTFIVTTKEERFVRLLLQREGIDLAETQIFGKAVKQPKAQTLRHLIHTIGAGALTPEVWFVEDRFKTLQAVKTQPDLQEVQLFLADWGYNTGGDRQMADQDERLHLLSLNRFAQEFTNWVSPYGL